jgi:hypothetical protein
LKVVLLIEWDNPRDEERLEKRYEFTREVTDPYWQRKVGEGIVEGVSDWADNTGHRVKWVEFESMNNLARVWDDKEYHEGAVGFSRLVDNLSFRLLRPTIRFSEDA